MILDWLARMDELVMDSINWLREESIIIMFGLIILEFLLEH